MYCRNCGQDKPEEEFNWRWKALGIRQPICRDCDRVKRRKHYEAHQEEEKKRTYQRTKDKRAAAREFVFDYLSYKVCEVCGEYRPEMLQFDHVRGIKKKDISRMVAEGYSIEAIKDEIAKCRVVCANCHQLAEKRRREGKPW